MTWLHRYSIRHPKRVVLIAVLVTLAIAPGAMRLELRTDGHALVPANAPEIRYDREIREAFGITDPIVVLIEANHPEGVFNERTLQLIKDLSTAFQEIEGVGPTDVLSLATEKSYRSAPGTLLPKRFLDPVPNTPALLKELRDDLEVIRLYTGALVSYDGQSAAVFVGVDGGVDRTRRLRQISDVIAQQGNVPESIHVIGAPAAESLLGTHILEDLGVPAALLGYQTMALDDTGESPGPTSAYQLRLFIARHIGLVPVAIGIMAIVFLVCFRSIPATFLPLMEVGACLVTVFGLMGLVGVPVYLTIAVLPVILTAVGVADEIHIFTRYTKAIREKGHDSHIQSVTTTMDEMWMPVTKTSITTAIAFLSFALSPIAPVRAFGVFTAVGVIFCMLWSLTVIPALLVLISPRYFARPMPADPDSTGRPHRASPVFAFLSAAVVRGRYVVLIVAVVTAALAPFGVRQVVVQDSWIDGFAEDSGFYRATQLFNEQFMGTHILLVSVDGGHRRIEGEIQAREIHEFQFPLPGDVVENPQELIRQRICVWLAGADGRAELRRRGVGSPALRVWRAVITKATREGDHILVETTRQRGLPKYSLHADESDMIVYDITPRQMTRPEVIEQIGDLEAFIESREDCAVGGVMGPAAYLRTTNMILHQLNEEYRRIPQDITGVEQAWGRYMLARGRDRLRQAVDEELSRVLVAVYMTDANFIDTARLMEQVRDYEKEHLAPKGFSLGFAGDVAVSQTLINAIVSTQTRSLLISLGGIFVVTALLGRSLKWGVFCVLPCAMAVMVNFAVMGLIGMPLGVATSMFAGMTLGIGVDYAIHLMERHRLARSRGLDERSAITEAVGVTGPAVVIDALAVGLGFGVLILSQVPANARLGSLLALSIVNCLAATLLLLPALLAIWPPRGRESLPADVHNAQETPAG